MRQSSLATSGPFAEAMAAQVNADLAIIAPDGFHPERGATFKNALDASLARKMADQSQKVIVAATKAKLMQVAQIAGLEVAQVDVLVAGCSPEDLPPALRDSGIQIVFAQEGP